MAVVGAGLAGLVAARDLIAGGASVVVVEARDRVGGRLLNEDIGDGKVVEVGGQWIGPTQDRMAALAREMGVDTFPTYAEGENVIEWRGTLRRYKGTIPRINPLVLLDVERPSGGSTGWRRTVPLDRPWTARQGRASGTRMTAHTWMRAQHEDARRGATCWSSASSRSGPPSPRTSRCCTCCSTSTRRAASRCCSTPRAARRTAASWAARSAVPIALAERLGDDVVLTGRPCAGSSTATTA